MKASLIPTCLIALGLAATATATARTSATPPLDVVRAHAGEPIDHVRLTPRKSRSAFTTGWEVLGERTLLLWHGRHEAWLVQLRESAACRPLDRQSDVAIAGGFDHLNLRGSVITADNGQCRIEEIREVDVPAMRAAAAGVASN